MEMHLQVSKARFSYDLQGSGTQSVTDLGLVNVACKWKQVTSVCGVVYCTRSSDTSPCSRVLFVSGHGTVVGDYYGIFCEEDNGIPLTTLLKN